MALRQAGSKCQSSLLTLPKRADKDSPMSSKLRTEYPEAINHVMSRGDQNEAPQTPPQAEEIYTLCQ